MARYTKKEREAAIARLREWIKPGDTIYTVLRHVSRSGMQRRIDLYKRGDDGMTFLSGYAATAMGDRWDHDRGGIVVGGCGMDMGFHLVYNLSYVLFPDGFGCIGEGERRSDTCPSNDHSNGDRDYTPHKSDEERRGADGKLCTCHREHWHKDGAYALRHEWI